MISLDDEVWFQGRGEEMKLSRSLDCSDFMELVLRSADHSRDDCDPVTLCQLSVMETAPSLLTHLHGNIKQ